MNSRQETLFTPSTPTFARIKNPNADEIGRLAQGIKGKPNKLLTLVGQDRHGKMLVEVAGEKEANSLIRKAKGIDPATRIAGEVFIHQSPKEEES